MSPRGERLTQGLVRELAAGARRAHRVRPLRGRRRAGDRPGGNLREISLGDFVLSGGEPAALALLDAVVRLLPGVMGDARSGA